MISAINGVLIEILKPANWPVGCYIKQNDVTLGFYGEIACEMVENGDGKPYGDLRRYLLGNMPTKIEGHYIVGVFT